MGPEVIFLKVHFRGRVRFNQEKGGNRTFLPEVFSWPQLSGGQLSPIRVVRNRLWQQCCQCRLLLLLSRFISGDKFSLWMFCHEARRKVVRKADVVNRNFRSWIIGFFSTWGRHLCHRFLCSFPPTVNHWWYCTLAVHLCKGVSVSVCVPSCRVLH